MVSSMGGGGGGGNTYEPKYLTHTLKDVHFIHKGYI